MTRYAVVLFLFALTDFHCFCQQNSADWVDKYWEANWITMPGKTGREYGVYHFRKDFRLIEKPGKFFVRVSADNRYRLFVNGEMVGYGPAQGSPQNWFYESYDIAPFLKAGDNAIAAQVWNYGEMGPWVQMSVKTGFILQGETANERKVNTDTSWRVAEDSAFSILPIDYSRIWDFIIVTPGDIMDANKYSWGWQNTIYDDSKWRAAKTLVKGAPYGTGTDLWWQLVPRQVDYLVEDTVRFLSVRRVSENISLPGQAFLQREDVVVAAGSRTKILLDQGAEITAYPEMITSGGRDALITISYAESMMDKNHDKGNRNDIDGKELYGVADRFVCDGGDNRLFRPLWFRAYRYVELEIETGVSPLIIHDFYGKYNHVKHPVADIFETSNDTLNHILNTAWHTQDICSKDYLLTDAYYEQLQYIGDNRIQGLVLNGMGYDSALVKNTIWQYYMSRTPEGLTQSRFPCAVPQVIPTYSLLWISMLHDYWKYYTDDDFIKKILPAANSIIDWYEKRIDKKTGMLGKTEFFNFVDWTKEWTWDNDKAIGGVPGGVNTGGSSITTMQLAYALSDAADLFQYIGDTYYAERYRKLAAQLTAAVWKRCWDEKKQLLADTPDKNVFSQHANIFGVLTSAIPAALQGSVIQRVANDTGLIQSSVYFRFYLGQAYKKAGLADKYYTLLEPWKKMLEEGLSTFAEVPGHARSDCHPWGCSPLYEFYATICGINPTGPGFSSIEIKPALGNLQWIKASMACKQSMLRLQLKKYAKTGISGEIILPPHVKAVFIWHNQTIILKEGKNIIPPTP